MSTVTGIKFTPIEELTKLPGEAAFLTPGDAEDVVIARALVTIRGAINGVECVLWADDDMMMLPLRAFESLRALGLCEEAC